MKNDILVSSGNFRIEFAEQIWKRFILLPHSVMLMHIEEEGHILDHILLTNNHSVIESLTFKFLTKQSDINYCITKYGNIEKDTTG